VAKIKMWRHALSRTPQRLLMGLVQGYRLFFKAWIGNRCRFEPSCSAYAWQALQRHGAWTGTALSTGRLLRCHPWCAGGHDPVPELPPGAVKLPFAGLFTRWTPSPTETQPGAPSPLPRKLP
jgi:uncharacterized protein